MKIWDRTFAKPEENLAGDEALLDRCEAGYPHEILRFWEPQTYFVVLGYSNQSEREVLIENCRQDGIPILRRPSGGGTVLQGPGCLNYSLILSTKNAGCSGISSTNQFVMKRHEQALTRRLGRPVRVEGFTDLAIDGLKFSGNSQRRKRDFLLFHGTFLLDFDLARIERYLAMPSLEPAYRRHRRHSDFLMNLRISPTEIKQALSECWSAEENVLF